MQGATQSQVTEGDHYDLVVIGGALSGSALALLLRRWHPKSRVLVVEKSEAFKRKVGEATTELSSYFLSHTLRLHDLLSREHLHKMGLRFWFGDDQERPLTECSEVSAELIPSLPSYQLDRARLDQSLLEMCTAEGAQVLRPAKITAVERDWPKHRVTIESDSGTQEITTRWIVDASGKRCYLGRQFGVIERFDEHQTAAAWGRWRGVKDLDGSQVLGNDVRDDPGLHFIPASRRLATNHFMGRGWWCWMIPLAGGETSLGLVWDRRLFDLEGPGRKRDQYEAFLRRSDGLGELLEGAELDTEDFTTYGHLAYRSRQYMDRGWALIGDAAAFIDPFYSPGLDHCATSTFATADLIDKDLKGKLSDDGLQEAIQTHNDRFTRSYPLYFQALYENKYEIMGDAELSAIAFYLDTAMYYLGVLHGPQTCPMEMAIPPFGRTVLPAKIAFRLMRFTNRRLVQIARNRQARGTYGKRNLGWTCMTDNFGRARRTLTSAHRKGLRMWAAAEARELMEKLSGTKEAAHS